MIPCCINSERLHFDNPTGIYLSKANNRNKICESVQS